MKIKINETNREAITAAQSTIADMSRLANETNEQAAERIAFFGEDCDKLAVIAQSARKIIEIVGGAA